MKRLRKSTARIYHKILSMLSDPDISAKDIAKVLECSEANVSQHIRKMKAFGFLKVAARSAFTAYEITKTGQQFLQIRSVEGGLKQKKDGVNKPLLSSPVRVHAMQVVLKIRKDNPKARLKETVDLKKVLAHYQKIEFPIPVTLQLMGKKNRSVSLIFHPTEVQRKMFEDRLTEFIMQGCHYAIEYLWANHQIDVTVVGARIARHHLATDMEYLREAIPDGSTQKVYFPWNAETLTGPLKSKAYGEFDTSKGYLERETNCMHYNEMVLTEPVTVHLLGQEIPKFQDAVRQYAESLAHYDKGINNHMGVIIEMKKQQATTTKAIAALTVAVEKLAGRV